MKQTAGMRVAALVPMRHQSERVPGKNYRPLGGKPLYRHIIESLLDCPLIHQVAIDTDSPVIMDDAARVFPQVTLLERPAHLRDGLIPMNDILLHDVERVAADLYVQTHSTNPFLLPSTITSAVETLMSHLSNDSLFSVTRLQTRLWSQSAQPLNHNPGELLRTQDLPPVFEENSCLYIFTKEIILRRRHRIGERPYLFEIDRIEAWDIDEEVDFSVAEALYQMRAHR